MVFKINNVFQAAGLTVKDLENAATRRLVRKGFQGIIPTDRGDVCLKTTHTLTKVNLTPKDRVTHFIGRRIKNFLDLEHLSRQTPESRNLYNIFSENAS